MGIGEISIRRGRIRRLREDLFVIRYYTNHPLLSLHLPYGPIARPPMTLYDPIHDTTLSNPPDAVELVEPVTEPVEQKPSPDATPETKPLESSTEESIPNAHATPTPASSGSEEDKNHSSGLKHVLAPTPRSTPSKRAKKSRAGGNNKGVTVLSSARSRHLKKEDGQPFWRRDIQYEFLKALFDNDVKAFTDPFPESPDNVNMDDRQHDPNGKLSFAELYIKSISHSSKCSKVLKERLLNDMKMSIPTCMICLLVNVGRMNTTINFVPDMKSQLRTYHPIPSLQVNYDHSTTGNDKSNDKQLQDTPRLKSILKACCDDTHESHKLEVIQAQGKLPTTTVVNMIFVLCNSEEAVMKEFFSDTDYYFFDIFINSSYDPKSRSNLFLWLLYNYLETHLAPGEIAMNPFGEEKPELKQALVEYDVDTPLEREFGEKLYEQRVRYLEEEGPDKPPMLKTDGTMTWKLSSMDSRPSSIQKDEVSRRNSMETLRTSSAVSAHHQMGTEIIDEEGGDHSAIDTSALATTAETSNGTEGAETTATSTSTKTSAPDDHTPVPTPAPVLRQDIDVPNVRKVLKGLKQKSNRLRNKMGLVKYENFLIHREGVNDDDASNRLRLKNYKGDFAEYHTKFHKMFQTVKKDFLDRTMNAKEPLLKATSKVHYTEQDDEPLKLKDFDIGI